MRTPKLLTALITFATMCCGVAQASPLIDQINVQGYMKKANNTAVTDGPYNMAFGVFQNGTALWGRTYSVTITDGMFSQTLSGTGSNQSALGAGTGMNANYTAVTLNPALLIGGASGEIMVRVYAVSAIDGSNPQFDISLGAVPTAFVADTALSVVNGGVSLAAISAAAKASTSAGAADVGKIPVLDAAGLLDASFIPTLDGATIGSGSVALGNGGTGSTTASGARTNLGAAASGSNADITELTGLTTALSVGQGGTGATTAGGALTNLGAAASGANGDITSMTAVTSIASSAGLTVASAAAGATTVGDNTGAASSTIRSGTGGIAATVTGVSGNVALTAGTTSGNVTVTPGSTSGLFTGTKGYAGGTQSANVAGTAQTIAGNGSSVILVTITTAANATVSIVSGCDSGVYAQGQEVALIMIAGAGANTWGYVDTAVAAATVDSIVLQGAYATAATASTTARGSTLKIMCTTINGVKKWVETGRSINAT